MVRVSHGDRAGLQMLYCVPVTAVDEWGMENLLVMQSREERSTVVLVRRKLVTGSRRLGARGRRRVLPRALPIAG